MPIETKSKLEALAAALFWGVSFVATKSALKELHPATLIVLRFAMGVAILWFAVWIRREAKWVGLRDLAVLAALGLCSITIHQGLQANGLIYTTASSMAWLVALTPVFTAILAWVMLNEPFGLAKVAGLVVAFVGAVVVVTRGSVSSELLRLPSTTGDLLALASSMNWAIFSVASKPMLKRLPPRLMMAYVMLIGWVLTWPFVGGVEGVAEILQLSAGGWIAALFLGLFCSGVAYIFWYDALANIDASQVAAFIYIEPLVTMVVAAIVLGEGITLASVVGGLTILLGVNMVVSYRGGTNHSFTGIESRIRRVVKRGSERAKDKG